MTHAYHHEIQGFLNKSPTNDAYGNVEDKQTISTSETYIAQVLGEDTRSDHLGIPFPTNGVTDRTPNPNGSRDAWRLFMYQLADSWLSDKICDFN
jgi:hypothetical protein